MPAFGYPWLFADRCVLRRLPVPRHPPCALLSLTCQYLFRYCLCQSCSNHFFWVLLHSHTLQFNVSVLFCLFRETIACFSGFTFFRFFFIQFSRYTCGGHFAPSVPLSTLVRISHLSLCRGFPRTAVGLLLPPCFSALGCVRLRFWLFLRVSASCSLRFSSQRTIRANCLRRSRWWAQVDSNHRPHAYQACALTT